MLAWKVLVSIEELSNTKVKVPPSIPEEKARVPDSDEESQEESSATLMDSKLERKQEEGRMKRRFKQGEGSNTTKLVDN